MAKISLEEYRGFFLFTFSLLQYSTRHVTEFFTMTPMKDQAF